MSLKKINSKGFSLIELLVVIAVLAVLAAVVVLAINPEKKINQAKDAVKKAEIKQISSALESYYVDYERYPSDLTYLLPSYLKSIPQSFSYEYKTASEPQDRSWMILFAESSQTDSINCFFDPSVPTCVPPGYDTTWFCTFSGLPPCPTIAPTAEAGITATPAITSTPQPTAAESPTPTLTPVPTPIACTLISSSWKVGGSPVTSVEEGTEVDMEVQGSGGECNGKTLSLEIYEDDVVLNDLVTTGNSSFIGSFSHTPWTALWMDDGLGGDPEYFFKAILNETGEERNSSNMNVTQIPTSSPTPSPVPTSTPTSTPTPSSGNLLQNAGFENPTFTTSNAMPMSTWFKNSYDSSAAINTTNPHSGVYSLRITNNTNTSIYQDTAVSSGQTVNLSGYVVMPTKAFGSTTLTIDLIAYTSANGVLGTYNILTYSTLGSTWNSFSGSKVLPANSARVRVNIKTTNFSGSVVNIDDLVFQ